MHLCHMPMTMKTEYCSHSLTVNCEGLDSFHKIMPSREIFIFIILFSPGDLAHVINRAKENGVEKVSCNMCIVFFFL